MNKDLCKRNEEILQGILNEYKGLRREELCQSNSCYSCVICAQFYSPEYQYCSGGSIGGACPDHQKLDVDTFALKYDFKL
jgi:hypothetical protein